MSSGARFLRRFFSFCRRPSRNPPRRIDKLKTRTSVGVSDATAVFGEPVTLSATVKLATGGSPVGIVKFKDVTAGALLGSAPLDANGVATLVVSSLKPGIHDIRGTFNGSTDQASSSGKVAWWSGAITSFSARTRDRW